MAENKKSFLIYCDLIHTVKKMKKEDVGELFLHLLEYTNDLNPITENPFVELVFEPIKQQLKRDLISWEKEKTDKSLNGRLGNLKRWNNDLFVKVELKELSLDKAEEIAKHRKLSHSDNNNPIPIKPVAKIAVTDTVTVNDTVIVTDTNLVFRKINHLSISFEDFEKLKKDFDEKDILDCFDRIENYKDNHKYISLFLTAKQWLNKQKKDKLKEESNGKTKSTPVIGRQTAETIEHNLQGWDKPTYD